MTYWLTHDRYSGSILMNGRLETTLELYVVMMQLIHYYEPNVTLRHYFLMRLIYLMTFNYTLLIRSNLLS